MFSASTVMTVAHRLETISDCDKILVMKSGKVAEFGAPKDLIQQNGEFARMQRDNTQE